MQNLNEYGQICVHCYFRSSDRCTSLDNYPPNGCKFFELDDDTVDNEIVLSLLRSGVELNKA